MGNGSSHGKDAQRLEKVPQGARVIGDETEAKQVTELTPAKKQAAAEVPEKLPQGSVE